MPGVENEKGQEVQEIVTDSYVEFLRTRQTRRVEQE
jgi:hypothetical protein